MISNGYNITLKNNHIRIQASVLTYLPTTYPLPRTDEEIQKLGLDCECLGGGRLHIFLAEFHIC